MLVVPCNRWPETLTTPYRNDDGTGGELNAGDLVFQDGVTFLGSNPWNKSTKYPLSLYIGHGDTRACTDKDTERCLAIQNQSQSGYKWQDGICVSQSFFDGLMQNGTAAGMVMFEQDYLCATQAATTTDLTTGNLW